MEVKGKLQGRNLFSTTESRVSSSRGPSFDNRISVAGVRRTRTKSFASNEDQPISKRRSIQGLSASQLSASIVSDYSEINDKLNNLIAKFAADSRNSKKDNFNLNKDFNDYRSDFERFLSSLESNFKSLNKDISASGLLTGLSSIDSLPTELFGCLAKVTGEGSDELSIDNLFKAFKNALVEMMEYKLWSIPRNEATKPQATVIKTFSGKASGCVNEVQKVIVATIDGQKMTGYLKTQSLSFMLPDVRDLKSKSLRGNDALKSIGQRETRGAVLPALMVSELNKLLNSELIPVMLPVMHNDQLYLFTEEVKGSRLSRVESSIINDASLNCQISRVQLLTHIIGHSDLNATNIHVENGQITGVFDMDEAIPSIEKEPTGWHDMDDELKGRNYPSIITQEDRNWINSLDVDELVNVISSLVTKQEQDALKHRISTLKEWYNSNERVLIKPDMTDQEIATILSEESTDFFNNSLFHEVRKGKVTSFNIRSSSSYVSPEGSQVASPETSSSSGDDFPMPIFPTPVAIKE